MYEGFAAYSHLDIVTDRTSGVLWERAETGRYQLITLTRLDQQFLESEP